MNINKQYTVISLFAGGGGSSLGYKWAGFKELLAIDFNKNSCETLKLNFDFPVWNKNILEISGESILEFCNIKKGELDILDGSPPCQGFSISGKRNLNDSRNNLFLEFIRLINSLHPKIFIMENVSGLIKGKMKGKFNEILNSLNSLNYNVKCKLLNSKWYEVPQSRERLFFIGVRKDLDIQPSFPNPFNKIITVREALENVIEGLSDGYFIGKRLKLVLKIKPCQNGSDICKNKYFNLRRLSWNKPSYTILKGRNLIHPKENRYMTIGELKRISSFPDNYKFTGSFTEQWGRIGNSVMPKMMYHIAKNIKENILNKIYKNMEKII